MKQKVTIHIGEYHAAKSPSVIHTLLGSCVAVCLYDPKMKIGGMNHILLPGNASLKNFDDSARYGINAMELLINLMMRLGCDRRQLTAKVFGGAHIISAISKQNGMGGKNTEFAMSFLEKENIQVVSSDLGGKDSRNIYFHTDSGDVFLKRTPAVLLKDIAIKEIYAKRRILDSCQKCGPIDIFKE